MKNNSFGLFLIISATFLVSGSVAHYDEKYLELFQAVDPAAYQARMARINARFAQSSGPAEHQSEFGLLDSNLLISGSSYQPTYSRGGRLGGQGSRGPIFPPPSVPSGTNDGLLHMYTGTYASPTAQSCDSYKSLDIGERRTADYKDTKGNIQLILQFGQLKGVPLEDVTVWNRSLQGITYTYTLAHQGTGKLITNEIKPMKKQKISCTSLTGQLIFMVHKNQVKK